MLANDIVCGTQLVLPIRSTTLDREVAETYAKGPSDRPSMVRCALHSAEATNIKHRAE